MSSVYHEHEISVEKFFYTVGIFDILGTGLVYHDLIKYKLKQPSLGFKIYR